MYHPARGRRMLLLDGPMGTELAARGVETPAPGWSAYAIDTHPDVVAEIHRDYAAAGAQVHRTNTFRTQPRIFPDRYRSLTERAYVLARRGVTLAGRWKPPPRFAGSLAPVFDCYRPDLSPPESEARAAHRAMASALADAGVDLVLCETFPHHGEAIVAVEEAAETGLEVWISLTAGPDGSLLSPEAMERAARDCVIAGATSVLVCCTAASLTLPYVERLARLDVPFGAYANAGDARDGMGWGAPSEEAAARYAAVAQTWTDAGASIVGSCCGTSPAHVAALGARR
ncbi:MAG: homocysteine S-methyltransferase family protein [Labilithrix sp.]|nr:homocysteine S-methyltransferase family protein [Labilithrix sp.]